MRSVLIRSVFMRLGFSLRFRLEFRFRFCGFTLFYGEFWNRRIGRKQFYAPDDVDYIECGHDDEEKEYDIHAYHDGCGDIIGVGYEQFCTEKSRNGNGNRQ